MTASNPLANQTTEALGDDAAHILVIDDDKRIRELLQRFLQNKGYRVTTAADGAEARRKMEGLDFDLLVLDVMMPGEDGFSLTRWLRARPGVAGVAPVIILTARGQPDDRIDAGLVAGIG